MRMLRSRPIKTIEGVTIGIAEFENTISEFVSAGGSQPSAEEMKSDLNAILQQNLSEQLAVRVSDGNYIYQGFRDFVFNQTAIILMNRNRLPLHAVEEPPAQRANSEEEPDGEERSIMAQGVVGGRVGSSERPAAGAWQRRKISKETIVASTKPTRNGPRPQMWQLRRPAQQSKLSKADSGYGGPALFHLQ